MAILTTAARKALSDSDFALPRRRYPIPNPEHAQNALARVSQFGTPDEKKAVRAAVHRKYPHMGSDAKAETPADKKSELMGEPKD